MKAFEKYNSKFSTNWRIREMKECERLIGGLPILDYYDINSTAAEEQGFRKGFRAALKWARDQAGWEREDITQAIDKELED